MMQSIPYTSSELFLYVWLQICNNNVRNGKANITCVPVPHNIITLQTIIFSATIGGL